MDSNYVIKIETGNWSKPLYYKEGGGQTLSIKHAQRFAKNSQRVHYIMNYYQPEYNVELINIREEIGTYISIHKRKHTFRKYLYNTLCILAIPILLPIVGIIELNNKILELCHISPYGW